MREKESEQERTCGSEKETGGKNKERAQSLRWAVHFYFLFFSSTTYKTK